MAFRRIAALALPVALAACSGAGAEDAIVAGCNEHLNVSAEVCDCIGDRAGAELTAEGRELLAAMVSGDSERAESIREGGIDFAEAARVATFMTTAPVECAQEQAGGAS